MNAARAGHLPDIIYPFFSPKTSSDDNFVWLQFSRLQGVTALWGPPWPCLKWAPGPISLSALPCFGCPSYIYSTCLLASLPPPSSYFRYVWKFLLVVFLCSHTVAPLNLFLICLITGFIVKHSRIYAVFSFLCLAMPVHLKVSGFLLNFEERCCLPSHQICALSPVYSPWWYMLPSKESPCYLHVSSKHRVTPCYLPAFCTFELPLSTSLLCSIQVSVCRDFTPLKVQGSPSAMGVHVSWGTSTLQLKCFPLRFV